MDNDYAVCVKKHGYCADLMVTFAMRLGPLGLIVRPCRLAVSPLPRLEQPIFDFRASSSSMARTRSDGGTSRTAQMLNRVSMVGDFKPRSSWEMNVRCNPDRLANSSWENPF